MQTAPRQRRGLRIVSIFALTLSWCPKLAIPARTHQHRYPKSQAQSGSGAGPNPCWWMTAAAW